MNRTINLTWMTLILLPIIPVALLYWFFGEQNYFELQSTAKGIVAFGPIAAYLVLVGYAQQIYSKTARILGLTHRLNSELPGDWKIESQSSHGKKFTGNCNIILKSGELIFSGSFEANGIQVGTWNSQLATIRDNRIYMFYRSIVLTEGENLTLDGVCYLNLSEPPIREMRGIWIVVGHKEMSGNITYTRNT